MTEEQKKQYFREYYQKHKDKYKPMSPEYKRAYYMKNRERILKKANDRYRIKCGLKPKGEINDTNSLQK